MDAPVTSPLPIKCRYAELMAQYVGTNNFEPWVEFKFFLEGKIGPLTYIFFVKQSPPPVYPISPLIHPSSNPRPLKAILKHALSYFSKRFVKGLWGQYR